MVKPSSYLFSNWKSEAGKPEGVRSVLLPLLHSLLSPLKFSIRPLFSTSAGEQAWRVPLSTTTPASATGIVLQREGIRLSTRFMWEREEG